MASEVKTIFTADINPLTKAADLVENRLKSLDSTINGLGNNTTFGKNLGAQFDALGRPINRTIGEIRRLEESTDKLRLSLSRPVSEKNIFTASGKDVDEFGRKLNSLDRQIASTRKNLSGGIGSEVKDGFAGGLGLPTGAGAAVALGTAFAVQGLGTLIDKSFEAERAQRLLSSSATSAGLSIQNLGKESKAFAIEGGLSEVSANKLTGQIARLTQAAGRPEDFAKVRTGLLDLASSRGKSVEDLEPFINALITGSSDEPLNNFGLKDPGALQKDYADKIKVSTEALSQQQQVLSRYNPFLELASTNLGANSDRLSSLSGQSEVAAARLDDLTTSLGKGITNSLEFRDGLQLANQVLGAMSINISDVQEKLAKGFTPRQIAEQQANDPTSQTLDIGKSALTALTLGPATYAFDVISGEGFKSANEQFIEIVTGAKGRRINALTGLIEGEQEAVKRQNKAAQETALANNLKRIQDENKAAADGLTRELSDLKSNAQTFAELDAYRAKFKDKSYLLDVDAYNKNLRGQSEAEAKLLNRSFDRILGSNPSLDKFAEVSRLFNSRKGNLQANELSEVQNKIDGVGKTFVKLADDYRESLTSLRSVDNPLVKMMSDFETATDRAQSKFGEFSDSIAAAERLNLSKAINLKTFENQSDALKLNQDARRLEAAPDRAFAPFQRSLELVERKADFAVKINSLNRQVDESLYYSNKFNPNNPKSFDESRFSYGERDRFASIAGDRKRGESLEDFEKRRREAIDIGIKAKDAISEIDSLNSLSLEGTGIYGKGAVADKILAAIPNREDLLKSLSSPFGNVRGNADFLLRQQSEASIVKRDLEKQKFRDFIEDQKTAEFGKTFAREQIGLINQSNLSDVEKAKQRLSVTSSLGNDLDAGLRRQQIQDGFYAGQAKLKENADALQYARETRDAVKSIVDTLAQNGIKIDSSTMPVPEVNVNVKVSDSDFDTSFLPTRPGYPPRASTADTARKYNPEMINDRQRGRLTNY